MNKSVVFIVVLLIIILGAFFFFSQDTPIENGNLDEETSEEETMEEEGEVMEEGIKMEDGVMMEDDEAMSSEVREFNVDGIEFAFTVSEMKVNVGDTVRVAFTNTGTMPHDFKIDEFDAATAIHQPGGQEVIEFVADKAGEFEYYCSVGNHRAQGMFGKLIVE